MDTSGERIEEVDTELSQLKLSDQLRSNSSFMKIMATLFYYGNQSMNAAQLVVAVRALNLLPLRGETPKSTIQGIISTSRKAARDLREPDPFHIEKDVSGRQAKYSITDSVLNGATLPPKQDIPDEPIILKPVEHTSHSDFLGKRHRREPKYYSPDGALRKGGRRRGKGSRLKRGHGFNDDTDDTDVDVTDSDSDMASANTNDDETHDPIQSNEDTIFDYSLLLSPPPIDMNYIDPINFADYPVASYFAIVQQKGYSYPRFRSHEKIKIPKAHCEDKYRVADITQPSSSTVIGRMFILADGHGGPGCSEFFVRQVPAAVQKLCNAFDATQLGDKDTQERFEKSAKEMVTALDEEYLAQKRVQLSKREEEENEAADLENGDEKEPVDNDGCTLIINIFLGDWVVNINVGDSRTILVSAPEPSSQLLAGNQDISTQILSSGADLDYRMDVVFSSQDHKPYLEHLAREILENGGEFVDSVQNRVIKVDLDKLRVDGNRNSKRLALTNARIRPKGSMAGHDLPNGDTSTGWTAQSAVRTTAQQSQVRQRFADDKTRSLNVARSCGDLDFKMNPERKIISCEPDVTFLRVSDDAEALKAHSSDPPRTLLTSKLHKSKRRHFLFMSTDGTFDYMYEEAPERQNRAVAKALGPLIEDGEKSGSYLLAMEEQNGGETIEHKSSNEQSSTEDHTPMEVDQTEIKKVQQDPSEETEKKEDDPEPKEEETDTPVPCKPLLFRELDDREQKTRRIRERTLTMAARFFANREIPGFFASKTQDYDDCTIMLIEI